MKFHCWESFTEWNPGEGWSSQKEKFLLDLCGIVWSKGHRKYFFRYNKKWKFLPHARRPKIKSDARKHGDANWKYFGQSQLGISDASDPRTISHHENNKRNLWFTVRGGSRAPYQQRNKKVSSFAISTTETKKFPHTWKRDNNSPKCFLFMGNF